MTANLTITDARDVQVLARWVMGLTSWDSEPVPAQVVPERVVAEALARLVERAWGSLGGGVGRDEVVAAASVAWMRAQRTVPGRTRPDPCDGAAAVLGRAERAVLARMDAARRAAEQRQQVEAGDLAVLEDPVYGPALDAWAAWQQATHALRTALTGASVGGVR